MRISLVILKELIEEGHVVNRHIKMLFEENAINSFEDLEIKNLAFIKIEKAVNEPIKGNAAAASSNDSGAPGNQRQQIRSLDGT